MADVGKIGSLTGIVNRVKSMGGGRSSPAGPDEAASSSCLPRRNILAEARQLWAQLEDLIIRPPRCEYSLEDLIGPSFKIGDVLYRRDDVTVTNAKGQVLVGSHYVPQSFKCRGKSEENVDDDGTSVPPPPCVVYCHGNAGGRVDANQAVVALLPLGFAVFAFDFSGSGVSEGEYVTLGKNETSDLKSVVEYLRRSNRAQKIGLWGRSMGATTSLFYVAKDPSIFGVVADSPYSKLQTLILEIAENNHIKIQRFFLRFAIWVLSKSIKKRAGVDIHKLDVTQTVKQTFVPGLFLHGKGDMFVKKRHTEYLHKYYAGEDKNIVLFEGTHNSTRPGYIIDSVAIFFSNVVENSGTVEEGYQSAEETSSQMRLAEFVGCSELEHICVGSTIGYDSEDDQADLEDNYDSAEEDGDGIPTECDYELYV